MIKFMDPCSVFESSIFYFLIFTMLFGFCCTTTRISHNYTLISSCLSPAPIPSHPSRSSQSARLGSCVKKQLLTSYPFYTWECTYVDATFSICLTFSHPYWVHKSILYTCASSPSLQISSLVPFSRFHISALIYDICFSLSDLLHLV